MADMRDNARRANVIAIVMIVLFVVGGCILLDRPLVRGDGLAYFMWLNSLARDGDLDLSNQAAEFATQNTYQVFVNQKTGRYASVFAFGNALLLVPFYWLGTLANRLPAFHINDAYFLQQQGATFAHSFFPMLGTNLYTLAAVLLAFFTARRIASHWVSTLSVLALFFGTPLWYYCTVEPLDAHACGTFALCLLLYLFTCWCLPAHPLSRRREQWLWLAIGLVGGLATLVRWQLALCVLLLGLVLLWQKRPPLLIPLAVGFAALAWLVPYSWWRMFGSSWVIPAAVQNRAAFLVWPAHLWQVLFSGEKGLFVWAPATALAVPGWVALQSKHRLLSVALAAMFVLQALISASASDWWAGWGFGMRRMIELYPAFVLGLASLLGTVIGRGALRRGYQLVVYLLTTTSVAFSVLLLFAHLNFINTVLDKPQGDTALQEIQYQLRQSSFHITRLVMKDHYGPWAWPKPGP